MFKKLKLEILSVGIMASLMLAAMNFTVAIPVSAQPPVPDDNITSSNITTSSIINSAITHLNELSIALHNNNTEAALAQLDIVNQQLIALNATSIPT
jgi:hypothetical protein